MTDAELHSAWLAGETVLSMAHKTGVTIDAMAARIRRLRRREGDVKWPRRDTLTSLRASHPKEPSAKRAGVSTLPPLASLKE
jgi:hypothetical protein